MIHKNFIILVLFLSFTLYSFGHSQLTIINNSSRYMTVKIMKGSTGKCSFYTIVCISPWCHMTVYFAKNKYYFAKIKAVLYGKEPIYQKVQPFKVYNYIDGDGRRTLTFSITESTFPHVTCGIPISKQEFDKN